MAVSESLGRVSSAAAHAGEPAFAKMLISQRDLRKIVPCSNMSLWRWQKQKIFPRPLKIGGRNFWELSLVHAWIEAQRATADQSEASTAA